MWVLHPRYPDVGRGWEAAPPACLAVSLLAGFAALMAGHPWWCVASLVVCLMVVKLVALAEDVVLGRFFGKTVWENYVAACDYFNHPPPVPDTPAARQRLVCLLGEISGDVSGLERLRPYWKPTGKPTGKNV